MVFVDFLYSYQAYEEMGLAVGYKKLKNVFTVFVIPYVFYTNSKIGHIIKKTSDIPIKWLHKTPW